MLAITTTLVTLIVLGALQPIEHYLEQKKSFKRVSFVCARRPPDEHIFVRIGPPA